jgi:ABC-type Fe3+ transport system substrate-binding protein
MRRVVTSIVIATTLVVFVRVNHAAPALGEKPVRWEYAELGFKQTVIPQPAQPGANPGGFLKTTLVWSREGEEIEGKNWKELADNLKAQQLKGESSATRERLRVLNRIGAEGWELVGYQPAVDPGPGRGSSRTESWTFKRPLP